MIDWVLSAKNLILGGIVAMATDYETCYLHSHRVPGVLDWFLPVAVLLHLPVEIQL